MSDIQTVEYTIQALKAGAGNFADSYTLTNLGINYVTSGGSDKVFWENAQAVTADYTITNNYNAGSFGPITINNGVTVTVGSGEIWTIV